MMVLMNRDVNTQTAPKDNFRSQETPLLPANNVSSARCRCGTSLVEIVVVISLSSVLLGLVAATWGIFLQADRSQRSFSTGQAGLLRLASQFRDDAHAAVAFEPIIANNKNADDASEPVGIRFDLTNGEAIRYENHSSQVVRIKTSSETGKSEREMYRLPQDYVANWPRSHEIPRVVSLLISLPSEQNSPTADRRAIQVDANLAWEANLAKGQAP